MNYTQTNKQAWEEAFEHRKPGWGDDNALMLKTQRLPFLDANFIRELEKSDWTGKAVAQFCCNNGRELLSLMQLGAARGVGFDIAENLLGQARKTAETAGVPCEFVCTDILQIGPEYKNTFDMVFFTIGAITWFQDVNALFSVVARCLKPGGVMYLHDFHPVVNMLPMPGEEAFDGQPKLAHTYFKAEPWIENSGMGYMTTEYQSKTFTSFSHTVGSILNALIGSGFTIRRFDEFDYDVGMTDAYDGKGFPLSMLLRADKTA